MESPSLSVPVPVERFAVGADSESCEPNSPSSPTRRPRGEVQRDRLAAEPLGRCQSVATNPHIEILAVEGCDCDAVGGNAVLVSKYDGSREGVGGLRESGGHLGV